MKVGIPGPEGSLAKWQWANLDQSLTELAADVLGPEALEPGSEWAYASCARAPTRSRAAPPT